MGRVQLNVWVEADERDAIKAHAASRGIPVGRLVVEAVLGAPGDQDARTNVQPHVRADEALERVAGVESLLEDLDRRVRRFEEMAHGQF